MRPHSNQLTPANIQTTTDRWKGIGLSHKTHTPFCVSPPLNYDLQFCLQGYTPSNSLEEAVLCLLLCTDDTPKVMWPSVHTLCLFWRRVSQNLKQKYRHTLIFEAWWSRKHAVCDCRPFLRRSPSAGHFPLRCHSLAITCILPMCYLRPPCQPKLIPEKQQTRFWWACRHISWPCVDHSLPACDFRCYVAKESICL